MVPGWEPIVPSPTAHLVPSPRGLVQSFLLFCARARFPEMPLLPHLSLLLCAGAGVLFFPGTVRSQGDAFSRLGTWLSVYQGRLLAWNSQDCSVQAGGGG